MKGYRPHSIKFNFAMNMVLKLSGVLFALVSYPYVLRVLGADGVGRVAFAASVGSFFTMIAALGIPTYGIRECARLRDDRQLLAKTVHELRAIQAAMTVLSVLLLAAAAVLIPRLREEPGLYLIQGIALLLGATSAEWLFAGLEEYFYITLRTTLAKFVCALLMFLLIRSSEDTLIYALLLAGSAAVSNVVNTVAIGRYVPWQRLAGVQYELKKHLVPILIFFAQTVAITVYTSLDSAMLGFMKGDYQVGIYDIAVKVKLVLTYVVTSLGAALLPRFSYYVYKKKHEDYQSMLTKALGFTLVTALPLMIFFFAMAPECVRILSGAGNMEAAAVMRVLVLTVILIGLSSVTGTQILVPSGREKAAMISYLVGAAVDIIFNVLLIPKLAAMGAAIGTLAAELAVLTVQLFCLRGRIGHMISKLRLWVPAVAAAFPTILLIIVKQAVDYSVYFRFFAGGALYALAWAGCLLALGEPFVCGTLRYFKGKLTGEGNLIDE